MPIELQKRKPASELTPSSGLIDMVKSFEGYVPYAYDDKDGKAKKTRITFENAHTVKGKLTIGHGKTSNVKPGDVCTPQQAEAWLLEDIERHAQIVRSKVTVPLTQGEFDALTEVTFNFGYIPKSMLACLNGGVTDKGVVMAPGSYGSALKEFPRNCRWGGIPYEQLYRRRLADACIFSDLPWRAACSENIVKLVYASGTIDPYASTSLEDTLMRARQDIPDRTEPASRPWPTSTTIITESPPAVTPAPSKPIPPAPVVPPNTPAGKADQPRQPPSPVSADSAPSNAGVSKPELPPPRSEGPGVVVSSKEATSAVVVAKPTALPAPVGTKPIHPETRMPDGVPYGVDPAAGAKPMEATERFIGSAMMWLANGLRVGMANGLKLTGPVGMVAVFFLDMMKTPVTAALVCGGIVAVVLAVGWFFGVVLEKAGLKKKRKGEMSATQLMY